MQTAIQTAVLHMGAVDADTAPLAFWVAPADVVIEAVHLVTSSAIAKHADNIHTSTATNRGTAGAGTTKVAEQTTDSDVSTSVAITAKTPWALLIQSAAAACMKAGEVLELAPTEGGAAGSGDLANAAYTIRYRVGTGQGYSA